MKILRIVCMLCALGLIGAKSLGNPFTIRSLGGAAGRILSSLVPGWKEEAKRFSGPKEARKWDMLARSTAYEMGSAFGVGYTIEY